MKIFIGSSTEQSEVMNKVSGWLQGCGHNPLPWNKAIRPGQGTLIDQLIRISHEVDGAIFIFAEDDKRVVRGAKRKQPRDNVVFEYGLFMGTLGAESVVFLRVGEANVATDLRGVVYIHLTGPNAVRAPTEHLLQILAQGTLIGNAIRKVAHWLVAGNESNEALHSDKRGYSEAYYTKQDVEVRARSDIENWASRLAPGYVKGLGFDLAKHLLQILAEGKPVGNILGEVAPRLVADNTSNEIRALCSDKGDYSEPYYRIQFSWAEEEPGRCIRRVFVRSRGDDDEYGFSTGETKGIKMHLDQDPNKVTIRWIYADSPWLGGPYSSSLGFAIFGRSWIMHWGLESGAFYDDTQGGYYGVGVLELLEKRFNKLWEYAVDFDRELSDKIRGR